MLANTSSAPSGWSAILTPVLHTSIFKYFARFHVSGGAYTPLPPAARPHPTYGVAYVARLVAVCWMVSLFLLFLSASWGQQQREAAARLVHSGAGVTCPPPCNASSLHMAIVDAHGIERRRGALRSSAALRETGGVGRAGDLVSGVEWSGVDQATYLFIGIFLFSSPEVAAGRRRTRKEARVLFCASAVAG